ncbi:MAG: hypothetical protein GQ557_00950 [Mycoplasmataceae bacterium]|nr:hypothetical protein [Mycoplasmataceae bacterium]
MTIPYFGDHIGQIITYQNYVGICLKTKDHEELLYYWINLDGDPFIAQNYDSPTYQNNMWDSNLVSLNYEPYKNEVTTKFSFINNFETYYLKYQKTYRPWETLDLIFLIDDTEVYETQYPGTYAYHETITTQFPVFNFDLATNDLEIEILLSNNENIYSETEKYLISNNRSSEYQIDFTSGLSTKVVLPIGIRNDQIEYETFTFEKLFSNDINSPQELDQLLKITYNDPMNQLSPSLINVIDAEVSFEHGYNQNYYFETKITSPELNTFIISVDDNFYYNESSRTVFQGESAQYDSTNSVIIPWDYANNSGEINLTIEISTYDDLVFNFALPISNELSLSGETDSKYFLIDNDVDFTGEYDYVFSFSRGDFDVSTNL